MNKVRNIAKEAIKKMLQKVPQMRYKGMKNCSKGELFTETLFSSRAPIKTGVIILDLITYALTNDGK